MEPVDEILTLLSGQPLLKIGLASLPREQYDELMLELRSKLIQRMHVDLSVIARFRDKNLSIAERRILRLSKILKEYDIPFKVGRAEIERQSLLSPKPGAKRYGRYGRTTQGNLKLQKNTSAKLKRGSKETSV